MANGDGELREIHIIVTATDEATGVLVPLQGVVDGLRESLAQLESQAEAAGAALDGVGGAADAIENRVPGSVSAMGDVVGAMAEVEAAARSLTAAASDAIGALQGLVDQARAAGYRAGQEYAAGMEDAIEVGMVGVEAALSRRMRGIAGSVGQQLAGEISRAVAAELSSQGVAL